MNRTKFLIYYANLWYFVITYFFSLILLTAYFGATSFIYFFILGTIGGIVLLVISGNALQRDLDSIRSRMGLVEAKKSKGERASEVIFYRIYEVIAALAVYVSSTGIIFNQSNQSLLMSPLQSLTNYPFKFIIYAIFIITSIQYIMGTSKHFEIEGPVFRTHGIFGIVNYTLIMGEASSLLAMGYSVAKYDIILFGVWYIALLVIDSLWVFLFKIMRITEFGSLYNLSKKITKIDSLFQNEHKLSSSVSEYWMKGNIAYIVFLFILEPVLYGIVVTSSLFIHIFVVLLLIMTAISTFFNSKAMQSLSDLHLTVN